VGVEAAATVAATAGNESLFLVILK